MADFREEWSIALMTQKQTPPFSTAAGAPVADNTNIMTAGPRGPALLQDVWAHREARAF
jgi:catalase